MCKQSFRIYERMIRLMGNEIKQPGLYRSELEHDACGIGAIVSINGIKTHQTVSDALSIVENLEHRAGKDAEAKKEQGVFSMILYYSFWINIILFTIQIICCKIYQDRYSPLFPFHVISFLVVFISKKISIDCKYNRFFNRL